MWQKERSIEQDRLVCIKKNKKIRRLNNPNLCNLAASNRMQIKIET